ncbi:MAG: ribonuclease HIII [Kiritimatiellaeota bacterium]|nr:ribonuclease HIII [Kiritimatiellota bacterium]
MLADEARARLANCIGVGNYRPRTVPYAMLAAEGRDCQITLYHSGKLVVQGRGAAEWIEFVLEPEVLGQAQLGYANVLHPELVAAHMGIDESGKGDFFGPLVIAAAYVDPQLAGEFQKLNVRDSKTITSDRIAEKMAADIRKLLGRRFSIVAIGPRAYNRLYAGFKNVNRLLAWGHARAIENLLAAVPDCPRALAAQFGPKHRIATALKARGIKIKLEQRHKAESDPAVAAASVLARAGFLHGLRELGQKAGVDLPKGASHQVQDAAKQFIAKHGPAALGDVAKLHFKTTDHVLVSLGLTRSALAEDQPLTENET